ncbi:hypothetical protein IE53DRAFT_387914 [Violaceomyces palustris]|uniref:Uncharacterized protein n=1 Tax=Violaceomyces palustris TaxID=1673888 RepID=A0ACD0NVK1_9BASI|nr:hypothetical protein IE53DRAFT_387914 [Violaceomyces palustris]
MEGRTFSTNGFEGSGGGGAWGSSEDSKPYYVTTPIFYVNAEPHIGHLHSCLVADVLARYQDLRRGGDSIYTREGNRRSRGEEDEVAKKTKGLKGKSKSILSTGTDEHGLKIQKVAERSSEDPLQLCDRISKRFKDLARAANVSYTRFIRTTDPDHREAVHHLWRQMVRSGHIYKGKHSGWYSVSDEAFFPESQVREVTDLKTGESYMESIETGSRLEWSEEENYKFRLAEFRERLIDWLEKDTKAIQPAKRHAEVLSELKSGLSDLSVSRPSSRLSWGIPVPDDPGHSIYVWVDALTNYLTVSGYPWKEDFGSESNRCWPADVHVVGKDIIRFHAIYWPAFLMACHLPLPKTILAHSHWTMNKSKMSKSKGNVANPFKALELYGVDPVRFFLMRVGGNFSTDSDYSPAMLEEYYKKSLQGQLGNLLSRILAPKLLTKLREGGSKEPLSSPTATAIRDRLVTSLHSLPSLYERHQEDLELSKSLESIFSLISECNELVSQVQPWSDQVPFHEVVDCLHLSHETLRLVGVLLSPFMPRSMETLLDHLRVPEDKRSWSDVATWNQQQRRWVFRLRSSQDFLSSSLLLSDEKLKPLFPRLEL